MILIAYDGTSDADHAISVAASLLPGGRAHVVYVWEPLSEIGDGLAYMTAATTGGLLVDSVAERQEESARDVAEAGAELARARGFDADGEAILSRQPAAQTLEAEVERLRPDLVVIGSRGLTGLKAFIKGSVSHHVGVHVHAPVLIVPPAPEPDPGD